MLLAGESSRKKFGGGGGGGSGIPKLEGSVTWENNELIISHLRGVKSLSGGPPLPSKTG